MNNVLADGIRRMTRHIVVACALASCGGQSVGLSEGARDAAVAADDAVAMDAPANVDSSRESGAPNSGRVRCGGDSGTACPQSTVCYAADCNGEGVCTEAESLCGAISFPGQVCGCDGQFYEKPCDAFMRGVMVGSSDKCPALEGRFRCGFEYCVSGTDYCRHHVTGDSAGFRECGPLPSACANALTLDCACVPDLDALSCVACRSVSGLMPYLELDCQGVVTNR